MATTGISALLSSEDTPPLIPGYTLLRRIGRGSYGEVWLARPSDQELVAVKVVYRKSFDHDRPFERELSGIRKFEPISRTQPSQVNILAVGVDQPGGYFYYVMELADDANTTDPASSATSIHQDSEPAQPTADDSLRYIPKTLQQVLQQRGPLGFRECLQVSLALGTALDHLHQHGLIHRDIKPSNVIFVRGIPKLADIGLVTDAGASISYVGTEGFLPPEGPGTPRADLYSLGKVLYEISTGRDRLDFPELPSLVDGGSEKNHLLELNQIILKACQNDPRRRYQSAQEMLADLRVLEHGRSVRMLRARQRRLARLRLLAAAVLVLAVLVGAGVLLQRNRKSNKPGKPVVSVRNCNEKWSPPTTPLGRHSAVGNPRSFC